MSIVLQGVMFPSYEQLLLGEESASPEPVVLGATNVKASKTEDVQHGPECLLDPQSTRQQQRCQMRRHR
jgi:hypothetical protein